MDYIKTLKDDLVDHLLNIDKSKLSIADLKIYSEIVGLVDELYKPDPNDRWRDIFQTVSSGFGGNYRPVEMKEV